MFVYAAGAGVVNTGRSVVGGFGSADGGGSLALRPPGGSFAGFIAVRFRVAGVHRGADDGRGQRAREGDMVVRGLGLVGA